MRFRVFIAAVVSVIAATASVAGAAPAVTTSAAVGSAPVTASPSKSTTRSYDLDFTLPTAGKSGCLVCHGDANLLRVSIDVTSSIFVDMAELDGSAHSSNTPCTGCHLDFAYTSPHAQSQNEDWQMAARSACKNCHKEQFSSYANGAHSPAGQPGVDPKIIAAERAAQGKPVKVPMCGDCHGGHSIPTSSNVEAQRALHRSGNEMCGQADCHVNESAQYEDYYHGAAYRRGSLDAPSCWDCHGYHDIAPASERTSPVHPSRLSETCGQEGCHAEADDKYFLEYAALIHGQGEIRSGNPIVSVVERIKSTIRSAFESVFAWL